MSKAKFNLINPIHFLALGFGSGLLKPAPGTWGTLAALPIYYLMSKLVLVDYLIITLLTFLIGIYLCDKAAKDAKVHDHPAIVWDEFVGLFISMIAIPFSWLNLLLGFLLFRFFDIIKPWPIKWLDKKVKGGFGIMIDDVLAGIFACMVLHGLIYFL